MYYIYIYIHNIFKYKTKYHQTLKHNLYVSIYFIHYPVKR